jgi:hypothetical protein
MDKNVKDRIAKRKIAYIYLLHRMFESNPAKMLKILGIPNTTVADIKDWDLDYREAVFETIREEDSHGVNVEDPQDAAPTIKSIKDKVLKRCYELIEQTTDPAKLAMVYKTLSEFESSDTVKAKSVIDIISETVKPLTPKKKEKLTMLERMKKENHISDSDDTCYSDSNEENED